MNLTKNPQFHHLNPALELLKPGCAQPIASLDLFDRPLREIGLVPVRVIQVHVLEESPWKQRVSQLLILFEFRGSPVFARSYRSTAGIDGNADPHRVEDFDYAGQMLRGAVN